jgi:hypothetical protein
MVATCYAKRSAPLNPTYTPGWRSVDSWLGAANRSSIWASRV